MKRVMLLTLLALALPTATLASTIDLSDPPPFVFNTGTFTRGVISRTASGGFGGLNASFMVRVVGSLGDIGIAGATLTSNCNIVVGSCTFSGGTVTVRNPAGTLTLFTDSLENGMISKTSGTGTIFADLVPGASAPLGGFVKFSVQFNSSAPFSGMLTGGSARLSIVPEPGGLSLLGTGLIGLAGIARRKVRTKFSKVHLAAT